MKYIVAFALVAALCIVFVAANGHEHHQKKQQHHEKVPAIPREDGEKKRGDDHPDLHMEKLKRPKKQREQPQLNTEMELGDTELSLGGAQSAESVGAGTRKARIVRGRQSRHYAEQVQADKRKEAEEANHRRAHEAHQRKQQPKPKHEKHQ